MRFLRKTLSLFIGLALFGALSPILMFLTVLSIPDAVLYGWAIKNPPIKRMMEWIANIMGLEHLL